MNQEQLLATVLWIMLISGTVYIGSQLVGCGDAAFGYEADEQLLPEITQDPQGALHPYCLDSAFMMQADEVLAQYNSPSLEAVYTIDTIDWVNERVKISPIYYTDPNLPVCVPYYYQSYDSVYGQNQQFLVRCKENFQPWLLALDTCQ